MLQEERQSVILHQVNLHHRVLTPDLCKQLNVSIDTIRRDLAELEQQGKLIKVHGGAISKSFHFPFQQPEVYAQAQKKAIAHKAVKLLQDGMVILAGGGTIMLELARIIPENLRGTFFTVSPLVALEVTQRSSVEVVLLSGKLARNSYICTGAAVVSQVAEIKADLCLLGTSGISPNEGITDHDYEVVQVKKELIKSGKRTAVMCISEKLHSFQHLQVGKLSAIDCLITELHPHDHRLAPFRKQVKVI